MRFFSDKNIASFKRLQSKITKDRHRGLMERTWKDFELWNLEVEVGHGISPSHPHFPTSRKPANFIFTTGTLAVQISCKTSIPGADSKVDITTLRFSAKISRAYSTDLPGMTHVKSKSESCTDHLFMLKKWGSCSMKLILLGFHFNDWNCTTIPWKGINYFRLSPLILPPFFSDTLPPTPTISPPPWHPSRHLPATRAIRSQRTPWSTSPLQQTCKFCNHLKWIEIPYS